MFQGLQLLEYCEVTLRRLVKKLANEYSELLRKLDGAKIYWSAEFKRVKRV